MQNEWEQEIYEFDTLGYTVIEKCLNANQINKITSFWEKNLVDFSLCDINFEWSNEWSNLIDNEKYFDILNYLFDGNFRLDHAYCADEKFLDNVEKLHHSPNPNLGLYHFYHAGKISPGLVTISISLYDIKDDQGGFICVPGSHKSYFPTPDKYFSVRNNNHLVSVPQSAGSAILFNEALLHGTRFPSSKFKRKSIFLRYCPRGLAFRKPTFKANNLPETPMHEGRREKVSQSSSSLSKRQLYLIEEMAFVRGRKNIDEL
ncbi:phytanoyl-CoA dioxygenase family protein [Nisaea sediminum]|uniref:phytanoyl-CoA dioxygenase family protein n=1 Tax=Nisaea sediminum TaxID=2775867 RepID=UPI0018667140|nr:phytanoyl-CoA dioxygenase family protein [Nisaea sediminum]